MSTFHFVLYTAVVLSNAISVEAAVYCDANNGQMEEADINSKVLDLVNAKRQEVLAGTQQNGKTGDTLPAAKKMDNLIWGCTLEEEAINILNADNCLDEDDFKASSSAPADKAYIYWGDVYTQASALPYDINRVLNNSLSSIDDSSALTDITASGEVKYSGEQFLNEYGALVRATTTEIGCALRTCPAQIRFSVICLTNEPPLQAGDVIYEFTPTTTVSTTQATTTAGSTAAAPTSTTAESIESTTAAATTTGTGTAESTTATPAATAETAATTAATGTAESTTAPTATATPTTTTMTTTEATGTPATTTAPTAATATATAAVTTPTKPSMCPDNGDNGMTDDLRNVYLAKHNSLRSTLALGSAYNGNNGTLLRRANKMPMLVYCCELEKSAYERAKQCNSMDSSLFGDVENNKNFTKNLNRTLEEAGKNAIQMWWAEIKTYGPIDQIQNIFYTHLGISSFAKVASDLTKGVGCSIVHCGSSINVVCHYATTLKNAVKLYNCGPYCKQCAGGLTSCVNGLCPATDGQCPASTAATIAAANTMCTNNIAMSDPLRTALLDKHNTLRSALATYTVPNGQTGKMLRRASKMPTLTYNCDLEKTAYEHALKCDQMGITSPDRLTENSHGFTITNKALTEAAKEAADSWWSEITALAAGIDQIQNLFYTHLGISSFAKMASDLTTQVGCGVAKCDSVINVVCHYNTTLANAVVLYKIGPSCNRCPQGQTGCINGLCPAE